MTDESNETAAEPDKIRAWGVIAGTLSFFVISPIVWGLSVQGNWIGPIAVLVALAGFVFFLYRSRQRGLAFGFALGYVLVTVFTGGICTGWNQAWL